MTTTPTQFQYWTWHSFFPLIFNLFKCNAIFPWQSIFLGHSHTKINFYWDLSWIRCLLLIFQSDFMLIRKSASERQNDSRFLPMHFFYGNTFILLFLLLSNVRFIILKCTSFPNPKIDWKTETNIGQRLNKHHLHFCEYFIIRFIFRGKCHAFASFLM